MHTPLVAVLAACGASPVPGPPPLTPEEEQALAEQARRADALDACVARIAQIRSDSLVVYYALPPSTTSTLVIRDDTIPSDPDDQLRTRYELRDDRGQEIGITHWICSADGLALMRVDTETTTISFDPPLPTVPLDSLEVELDGTLHVQGAGTSAEGTYRWRATSAPASAPLSFLSLPATWTRVDSVLETHLGEDGDGVWTTSTLWALGETFFFAAEREIEERFGGPPRRRVERADHVDRGVHPSGGR